MIDKCLFYNLFYDIEGFGKKLNDVVGGLGGGGVWWSLYLIL